MDLDGTLIRNDVTWVNFKLFIKRFPFLWFCPVFWILRGRAHMKSKLADMATIDVATLPYNREFLAFLTDQKKIGTKLYLVTACDITIAKLVSDHLGIFDDVMASNGCLNLRAGAKANALCDRFGHGQFTYAGNSYDDLSVWKHAHGKIVVNPSKRAKKHINFEPDLVFD